MVAAANTRIKNDKSKIKDLVEERESLAREIELATVVDDTTIAPVDSIRNKSLELSHQVHKSGLIGDKEFSQDTEVLLLELQSSLEESLSAKDHQLVRLSKLLDLAPMNETHHTALERTSLEIAERLKKKTIAEKKLVERREESERHKQSFEKSIELLNIMKKEKTDIDWLLVEVSNYVALQEQLKAVQKDTEASRMNIRELKEQLVLLEEKKKSVEETKGSLDTQIQAHNEELQGLVSLAKEWLVYKEYERSEARLKEECDHVDQEVSDLESLIQKSAGRLKELVSESVRLQNSVESLQSLASDKHKALDNIERWIEDASCPVCGVNHGEQDELQRRFEEQRGKRSSELEKKLDALNNSRESIGEMNAQIGQHRVQLQKLQEHQTELLKAINNNQNLMENSRVLAVTLGFEGIDMTDDSPVQKRIRECEKQITSRKGQLSSENLQLNQCLSDISDLTIQKDVAKTTLDGLNSRLTLLRLEMDNIEESARAANRDIQQDISRFQAERDLLSTKAITIDAEISESTRDSERLKADLAAVALVLKQEEEGCELLSSEIVKLEYEERSMRSSIGEYQLLVEGVGLEKSTQREGIEQEEQLGKKIRGELMSFRDKAVDLRVALAATRSSAIIAQSKNKLERIDASLKEIQKGIEVLQSLSSFFRKVGINLDAVRQSSVTNYIKIFGPLASNIQARLRSVYRFGDIELLSESGNINVRVTRADSTTKYRPSDYFSGSQMQIAMLSLFLSAALTQNWSRFAPILLDDPVEHFDDLNCYSLLDLIKSITASATTGRQVLISTCDDRLFRLMRHRFSASNLNVIYYKFESIGSNGPEVTKLES